MRRRPLLFLTAALVAVSVLPATTASALDTSTTTFNASSFPRSPATRTAIVMTPEGNPVVASWNEETNRIDVVACRDPLCVRTETPRRFWASEDGDFDMAIGGDGKPVLVIPDNSQNTRMLVVFKCSDSRCSGSSREFVEFNNSDFLHNVSIAVGEKSKPFITYTATSQPQDRLRLLACSTDDCSGFGIQSALYTSSTGNVQSDVTVTSDHLAKIVFSVDRGPGWLAKCSNRACSSRTYTGFSERNPVTNPSIASNGTDVSIVWIGRNRNIQKQDCSRINCAGVHSVTTGRSIGFAPNIVSLGGGREIVAFIDLASRLVLADCNTSCARPDVITGNGSRTNAMLGMVEFKGQAVVSHRHPSFDQVALTFAA